MSKNVLSISIFVLLFIGFIGFIGFIIVYNLKSQRTFTGYIIDKHCSTMKDPAEETKMCLNMKSCAASGYGISVKQSDDKYKFYKFDDKGQELAKDIIGKTTKEKGISIAVKGIVDGDLIKVSTISEK